MPDISYREQLGQGLAVFLAGRGLLAWDADYAYPLDAAWPTYVQQDAPPTPHQLVHIAVGTQTRVRADLMTMVQVRVRGDQDADDDVAALKMQDIQDALAPNGFPLVHAVLGSVRVGMVQQVSATPLGRDLQRRNSHVTNFRIRSRRSAAAIITPPTGAAYGAGIYGEGLYGA